MMRLIVVFPILYSALLTLTLFGGATLFVVGGELLSGRPMPDWGSYALGIAPPAIYVFLVLFVGQVILLIFWARRNWS